MSTPFEPIKDQYDPRMGLDAIKQEKELRAAFDKRQAIAEKFEFILIKEKATLDDMDEAIKMLNQRQALRMKKSKIEKSDELRLDIRYQ